MIVVGMLSWFEERPDWLREAIRSYAQLIDALVAIDGAYAGYPKARPVSDDAQHRAIVRECRAQGLPLQLELPPAPWSTEMAKRTALFRAAERLTVPLVDWVVPIDADERLEFDGDASPRDLRALLEELGPDENVGELWMVDVPDDQWEGGGEFELAKLFRAIPGIQVEHNHWNYTAPGGRVLWGPDPTEKPVDLTAYATIRHLTNRRPKGRHLAQKAYYDKREADRVEGGRCHWCDATGGHDVQANWRLAGYKDGVGYLTADNVYACDAHLDRAKAESDAAIAAHGLDPSQVKVTQTKTPRNLSNVP